VISDEEIRHLEAVLAGAARSRLRPPAVLGRLTELYLQPSASRQPDRALELVEQGLAMVANGDPLYPKLLHYTAAALRAVQTSPAGALGHGGRAARLDRDAWLLSLDPVPGDAVLFAGQWGDWAWQNEVWDEAAEAYEGAALALTRIVLRSTPGIMARLDLLSQHANLAPRSAFAYARIERAKEAVTVLERAGDLLSAFGSQRRDLDKLGAMGKTELRDRLLAVNSESVAQNSAQPDSYGRSPVSKQQAQTRVDAMVKEIRAIPGMARFATPAGWADVSDVAQAQPIAYLATTDKGTVVLTVTPAAKSIACLPVTQQDILSAVREFFLSEYEDGPADSHDALMKALDWLSRLMFSVFQAVGGDHRVLLVPFGLLAQLPLHAACAMLPATDTQPARNHFWFHPSHVTYVGSARSWLACKERSRQVRVPGALVVNSPAPLPAEFDELLLSDFERDVVASHFPVTELTGTDATDDRILAALPEADVAHFICHGQIDKRLRYTGVLIVADQKILTVRHLENLPGLTARLVFLSACTSGMTALGVAQLASIPTALVGVGAAAVIATFWKTDEMATLLVVTRFHDLWQGGRGADLAEALGQARVWLATSRADVLRAAVPAAALAGRAGQRLASCQDEDQPYSHPWFWAPFFLLGA
jgi:hypothetical protein